MSSTTSITVSRRSVKVAAGCTLAVGGVGFMLAGALPAQAELQNNDQVWVCKFVGPRDSERLSTGDNPTLVNWRAIAKEPGDVFPGAFFGDNQERSYVIQINGANPGRDACFGGPQPTDDRTTTVPPTTTEPTDDQTTTVPPTTTEPTDDQTTTVPPTTTEPTDDQTSEPPATTTVPPTTSEPTTVPPTTVPPTTHPMPPAVKPTAAPPHGTGHTPSVVGGLSSGAPHTGGSGEAPAAPTNTVIGAGLLFAALGLFSRNVLGGRKSDPDSTN